MPELPILETQIPERARIQDLRGLFGEEEITEDAFDSMKEDDGCIGREKVLQMVSDRLKHQNEMDEIRIAEEAFELGVGAGLMVIRSISALDMKSKELLNLDKLDPYLCISFTDKLNYFTKVNVNAGENSAWTNINCSITCDKKTMDHGAFTVEVWDKNYVIPDKLVGYAMVPVQALLDNKNKDEVLTTPIMSNGEVTGKLVIIAQFEVNRPRDKFITIRTISEAKINLKRQESITVGAMSKAECIESLKNLVGSGGNLEICSVACHNMKNKLLDILDPYVTINLLDKTLKTEAQIDAGESAQWEDLGLNLVITDWNQLLQNTVPLKIEVWDKNNMRSDEVIGVAQFSLITLLSQPGRQIIMTSNIFAQGKIVGQIVLMAQLSPNMTDQEFEDEAGAVALAARLMMKNEEMAKEASSLATQMFNEGSGEAYLQILSISALDLKVKALLDLDKLDPYVKVVVDDSIRFNTDVKENAGENASWNDLDWTVLVDTSVVTYGHLKFEVWDKNYVSSDRMVGTITVQLETLVDKLNTEVVVQVPLLPQGSGRIMVVLKLVPEASMQSMENYKQEKKIQKMHLDNTSRNTSEIFL